MTRRASISSRIFMEPISAVKAEPERPATMMEVSRTASSRRTRMPIRSTTNGVAPNLNELEDALLRDDAADQERDQHDDRHAPIGDLLELVDHRRAAEPAGMDDDPHEGPAISSPRNADAADEVLAGAAERASPDIDQEVDEPGMLDGLRLLLEAAVGDLIEKDLLLGRPHWRNPPKAPVAASSCRVRSRTQAPRVSRRCAPRPDRG